MAMPAALIGPVPLWLCVGVLALIALSLWVVWVNAVGKRREAEADPSDDIEEEVEAAIDLHEIRRRLEAARARGEIHRDSETLRQQIEEEIRNGVGWS
jgi:hypothetical protein